MRRLPHAAEGVAGFRRELFQSHELPRRASFTAICFPAANTGVAFIRGDTNTVKAQEEFLKGSLRVDIFGIKEGGSIDNPLTAPLRPKVPALKRGQRYLLEVVLRTLRLGHPFTQGTVDSNEVWVDAKVKSGDQIIGRNGGLGPHNEVDPWSHFVNVYHAGPQRQPH